MGISVNIDSQNLMIGEEIVINEYSGCVVVIYKQLKTQRTHYGKVIAEIKMNNLLDLYEGTTI